MLKFKEKIKLHPIMTFLVLIAVTILVSGLLSWLGAEASYNTVNSVTNTYDRNFVEVESLLSLSGLKYIFSSTVSNFASFTPLSMLIIILIGIGIMEKSGFLKTAFTILTKNCQKKTITFILVLICLLMSICGDLGYVVMIPISALLFLHGRRNPSVGIITAFAALTCGSGLNIFLTSIDSSLLNLTLSSTHVLDANYTIGTSSFLLINILSILILAFIITTITEKIIVEKVDHYEFKEEKKEYKISRRELRGLVLSLLAAVIYLIIFIYNIIPGLPFSGNLLDYSQSLYIDKLFSPDSFFSQGFVFIVTILFVILGFFYGIGARTIKDDNDLCDDLGHSLDGIGKTIILIFMASVLINIFKKTNMGTVFTAWIANLLGAIPFSGIPLIVTFFILVALCTILMPTSVSKWTILAGSTVPVFMNAGLSPEFTQIIFRFAESTTIGLTPLLAYFVIYLAFLEKYNQSDKTISLFTTIKYQTYYSTIVAAVLIIILIIWYIIGLPLGIGSIATI